MTERSLTLCGRSFPFENDFRDPARTLVVLVLLKKCLPGDHGAHLSCGQQTSSHHPEVGLGEQSVKLCGVLGQSPVAHLGVAELPLDDAEGVLDLGADTGLGVFQLFHHFSRRGVGQRPTLARPHGDVPVHVPVFELLALVDALIAGIRVHLLFLAVQQLAGSPGAGIWP